MRVTRRLKAKVQVSFAALAVVALATCSAPPQRQTTIEAAHHVRGPWPPESPVFPLHPGMQFESFANGLRLAWLDHPLPPGRCSLRLVVHVGSLDELDGERGMAHFIEHMAFNGTEKFPGTSIIPWFNSQGMASGRDVNASTSYTSTIFNIDLAHNDAAAVLEGLEVLRDLSMNMTLDPDEVESEKLVVDAEERSRLGRYRATMERWNRLTAGTTVAARSPIGVKEDRQRFTAVSARAFHTKWYRPENLTLLVLGDIAGLDTPDLVGSTFGKLPVPSTSFPNRQDRGVPLLDDTVFSIADPDRQNVEFMAQWLQVATEDADDSAAELQRAVSLEAACAMANWMLSGHERFAASPFLSTSVSPVSQAMRRPAQLEGVSVHMSCLAQQSERALNSLALIIEAIRTRGFSQELLERVRLAKLAEIEAAAAAMANASGPELSNTVAMLFGEDRPPTSALSTRARLRDAWNALDASTCTDALRSAMSMGVFSIASIGPQPPELEVLSAWNSADAKLPQQSNESVPSAAGSTDTPKWPYEGWPPEPSPFLAMPAPVHSRELHADIGVEEVHFWNGIRLLVKETDVAKDEVLVSLHLGEGMLASSQDAIREGLAAAGAFAYCGLTSIDSSGIREHSIVRRAGASLSCGINFYALGGATNRADLTFQLELLAAYCGEASFDQDAVTHLQRLVSDMDYRMEHSYSGARESVLSECAGSQTLPRGTELSSVQADGLQHFATTILGSAPLTVVVVGDVSAEDVIERATKTFGRLAPRTPATTRAVVEFGSLPGGTHLVRDVETTAGESQAIVFAAIPGGSDLLKSTLCPLLGGILQARLFSSIREALGATYSPRVSLHCVPGDVDHLFLLCVIPVAIGDEQRVLDMCLHEVEQLSSRGVTASELNEVREPVLRQFSDLRNSNKGWQQALAGAHLNPDGLTDIATIDERTRAITVEDLSNAAATYLRSEVINTLILRPASDR